MMTSAEISDLRLMRTFELANIKADLLGLVDCKGDNLLRIRKARLRIDELRESIERDYYKFSKQSKQHEEMIDNEAKRKRIEMLEAQRSSLEAEIERIKREL